MAMVNHNDMDAGIVTISPEVARRMLDVSKDNFRKMSKLTVSTYARAMSLGEWKLNGEAIKIVNGSVTDGQHRLNAVIESGATIRSLVTYNFDQGYVDTGKRRSVADYLRKEGFTNCNKLAALMSWCLYYKSGKWGMLTSRADWKSDRPTIDEFVRFAKDNRDRLYGSISVSEKHSHVISSSFLNAIYFIGSGNRNPMQCDAAVWFSTKLANGEMLSNDEPVFHLRKRLLEETRQKNIDDLVKRGICTLAWNKTVECTPVKNLKVILAGPKKKSFPKLINIAE